MPPVGGDTCFASLERAYEVLTPGMVAVLERLTGIHSAKGVFAINAAHKGPGRAAGAWADIEEIEVEHPVICAHPKTGRRYVFVSSVLQRFKGPERGREPADHRLSHGPRRRCPEFTCRVRWETGTLTLWANPFLLHTAINDYPGQRRVTYRSTVEGWVPQAAPPDTEPAALPQAACQPPSTNRSKPDM